MLNRQFPYLKLVACLAIPTVLGLSSCRQSTINAGVSSLKQSPTTLANNPPSTFEGSTYACSGAMSSISASFSIGDGDRRAYIRDALRDLRTEELNETVKSYLKKVEAVVEDPTRPISDVDKLQCL